MSQSYRFPDLKPLTKQGLYDPSQEHDACGVGLVANIDGRKSHEIIEQGIEVLKNLEHRGAKGADPAVSSGNPMVCLGTTIVRRVADSS